MTDLHCFLYESTDVPPGMTLAQYRYRSVRPRPWGRLHRVLAHLVRTPGPHTRPSW